MSGMLKEFKAASTQTKIFWIVALAVGILTAAMCLYPYFWFNQNRSGKENISND